jgi:ribosomal protein L7/L12
MVQISIAEALAQVEQIDRHIARKEQLIEAFLLRPEQIKDPLAREGGTPAVLEREWRSIQVLGERKLLIRRAVQEANQRATITLGQETWPIADWLVWRREVVPFRTRFLDTLRQRIAQARQQAATSGKRATGNSGTPSGLDVVVHLDEQDLARQTESLEERLGLLDGQLTLKNALLQIELPPDDTWKTGLEEKIDSLLPLCGPLASPGFCTVLLEGLGDPIRKIQLIKVVREITLLGLKDARDLVEQAPRRVKENIPRAEALAVKQKLEEAGGRVALVP